MSELGRDPGGSRSSSGVNASGRRSISNELRPPNRPETSTQRPTTHTCHPEVPPAPGAPSSCPETTSAPPTTSPVIPSGPSRTPAAQSPSRPCRSQHPNAAARNPAHLRRPPQRPPPPLPVIPRPQRHRAPFNRRESRAQPPNYAVILSPSYDAAPHSPTTSARIPSLR